MTKLAEMSVLKLKEEAWKYDTRNPKLQPILDELAARGIKAAISREEPPIVIGFYAQKTIS